MTFKMFKLSETKLCGLITDGAPAMTGKHNGFVNLMKQSVPQEIIIHHCILHQEQLCAKTLEMKHIMDNIVASKFKNCNNNNNILYVPQMLFK